MLAVDSPSHWLGINWEIFGVLATAAFAGSLVAVTMWQHWVDGRRIRSERARRETVKAQIGNQMDEVTRSLRLTNTEEEFWSWINRTGGLIDAAFGRPEEHLFMLDVPLDGYVSDEAGRIDVLMKCYRRLLWLLERIEGLTVREDFDPKQLPQGSDT